MNNINFEDITVVVQGTTLENKDINPSRDFIYKCISSIKKYIPKSKIILSTWENEKIKSNLEVDEIIFNKDPGFKPRGEDINSKQNNINRQLVSTLSGLKKVKTKYALKFRTDFIFINNSFLNYFDLLKKYNSDYKILNKRILVCMFGTRHPIAKHFNLPFHVADFVTFGLTEDLTNLYDIPLVTNEEFDYFLINPEIERGIYAVNRYGAEQSIIVNFLRKNNKTIDIEFSTHVNETIINQSNNYLINNFYPICFSKYGIKPMKNYLMPSSRIECYTDYYTEYEWQKMYKELVDDSFILPKKDYERIFINKVIKKLEFLNKLNNHSKFLPGFVNRKIRRDIKNINENKKINEVL